MEYQTNLDSVDSVNSVSLPGCIDAQEMLERLIANPPADDGTDTAHFYARRSKCKGPPDEHGC